MSESCTCSPLNTAIKIGALNVIHPHVVISENCTIGSGNIFNESVSVGNADNKITIGDNNYFETACIIQGNVGSNCTIGVRAEIIPGAVIGDNSVIGPGCKVAGVIPEETVVFNNGSRRSLNGGKSSNAMGEKHAVYLREILPLYHNT
jgi:carbonic anhydrase/acetyltransferase-like protein (isoleucine patch superfamily)